MLRIEFTKTRSISHDASSKRGLVEQVSGAEDGEGGILATGIRPNGMGRTRGFQERKLEDNGISFASSDDTDVGFCDDARRSDVTLFHPLNVIGCNAWT